MSYYQQNPYHQPQPKKRRGKLIAVVVAVVVVLGAAGAAVWLWQDTPSVDLPANPDLDTLAFPDLNELGYDGGPDEMCGAVAKVMSARGYSRITDGATEGGINCRSITPGLSLLTDGALMISADVAAWRDNAEDRYQRFYDKAVSTRDAQLKNPDYEVSKIEQFPAGDGGYIYHRATKPRGSYDGRTDTEAVFRSGDDLMWIAVWGTVNRVAEGGEPVQGEALPEDVTYGEISDIVMALSGDGTPGEPRLTPPDLAEHPTLTAAKAAPVAEGATKVSVCEKLASAAGSLGVAPVNGRAECTYEPPADASYADGSVRRTVKIDVRTSTDSRAPASERMADDLRSLLDRTSGDGYTPGRIYALPVGDSGYAMPYTLAGGGGSSRGLVQAGYVSDATYVLVTVTGEVDEGSDLVAVPEDGLLADLVTVLTAIGG